MDISIPDPEFLSGIGPIIFEPPANLALLLMAVTSLLKVLTSDVNTRDGAGPHGILFSFSMGFVSTDGKGGMLISGFDRSTGIPETMSL